GVVALVVLAAELAGIGEATGRRQRPQVGAGLDLADQHGDQLFLGRVLQQGGERFELAEIDGSGAFGGERGRGETHIGGDGGPDRGDEHAAAHVGEEFAARVRNHASSPRGGNGNRRRETNLPYTAVDPAKR